MVIAAALALTLIWMTLPPDQLALNESCAPDGFFSRLSSWTWSGKFWRNQRIAVAREIHMLQTLRDQASGAGKVFGVSPIEQRMRRLTDQELADLAASNEDAWRARIMWLGRCDQAVAAHLAP